MTAMKMPKRSESVFQELAVVIDATAGQPLVVESASGRFEARRAASCLLAPEVEDQVLVAVPSQGPVYVLAVLERTSSQSLRLELDAEAELVCRGPLTVFSPEKIELRAGREVGMKAHTVRTMAAETHVHTDRLSIVGRLLEANTQHVKGVLGMVDTVLDRLTQKVKSSYRYVEELDMTRAGDVDMRAQSSLSVRGKNAFVSADELVKVHADQIHLG